MILTFSRHQAFRRAPDSRDIVAVFAKTTENCLERHVGVGSGRTQATGQQRDTEVFLDVYRRSSEPSVKSTALRSIEWTRLMRSHPLAGLAGNDLAHLLFAGVHYINRVAPSGDDSAQAPVQDISSPLAARHPADRRSVDVSDRAHIGARRLRAISAEVASGPHAACLAAERHRSRCHT